MDYSNRNAQQIAVNGNQGEGSKPVQRQHKGKLARDGAMWTKLGVVAAIVAVVVLLVGIIVLLYSNNNNNKATETQYVDSSKLQAVFLNTGQVYFGNIKTLNSQYTILTNIYYLQTTNASGSSSTANNSASNVTLVKLGCELHRPFDQMVINNNQVTFWENLQSDGQVAKAVSTFQQQNPNGQKCADQSSSSTNTSNAVQNSGTNSSSTKH